MNKAEARADALALVARAEAVVLVTAEAVEVHKVAAVRKVAAAAEAERNPVKAAASASQEVEGGE